MGAGNAAAVSSPPLGAGGAELEAEVEGARQRLFELGEVLTERFDRGAWDEYVKLRRAERAERAERGG